jgi:hypothetical protein
MFLKFNDVLVRDEKRELSKRCFNRCYAAVNISHEYEEARIVEGLGKVGVPNNDRRAPPRRDPCGRSGRVWSRSNRIAANPRNAASIVAIERRPLTSTSAVR